MNTKIKIAIGMFAGLVAGTMIVGTAVAAPRMMAAPAFNGYGMMRALETSGTFEAPTIAEMNSFMNRYRTANGSIDFNRMHADVTSGKVTPPCVTKTATQSSSTSQSSARPGPAMMRGWTSNAASGGYTMMGGTY
jgi:hypothetical protein